MAAPDGRILASIHGDRLLVPASILKLVTALAALHYLGEAHRFKTEFFSSPQGDLIIKGYGDPLLVSEQVRSMAGQLAARIRNVRNLVLDDSYFAYPIIIPGRSYSTEPYDAPNGALCVNFNTAFFERRQGHWVSAEPQTPLLPSMLPKIEASGLSAGRITLAANREEILRYAGELFSYFLKEAGVVISGQITIRSGSDTDRALLWRYQSDAALTDILASLLMFSNNYIANQLLLAMGAAVHGAPATVEKGMLALNQYGKTELAIKEGQLVEASGIAHENRISALTMLRVLEKFQPYHALMRKDGRQWYKTGTLNDVHTRAGYMESGTGTGLYRFVVMSNTPGKTTDRVMQILKQELR